MYVCIIYCISHVILVTIYEILPWNLGRFSPSLPPKSSRRNGAALWQPSNRNSMVVEERRVCIVVELIDLRVASWHYPHGQRRPLRLRDCTPVAPVLLSNRRDVDF